MLTLRNITLAIALAAPATSATANTPSRIINPAEWSKKNVWRACTAIMMAEQFGDLSARQEALLGCIGAYIYFARFTNLDAQEIKSLSRGNTDSKLDLAYYSLGLVTRRLQALQSTLILQLHQRFNFCMVRTATSRVLRVPSCRICMTCSGSLLSCKRRSRTGPRKFSITSISRF